MNLHLDVFDKKKGFTTGRTNSPHYLHHHHHHHLFHLLTITDEWTLFCHFILFLHVRALYFLGMKLKYSSIYILLTLVALRLYCPYFYLFRSSNQTHARLDLYIITNGLKNEMPWLVLFKRTNSN